MSSVLADFTARFTVEAEEADGPTQGRVLLGNEQLVLVVNEDTQVTIPLSAVVDVNVGSVPQVFDPLPGMPVTVAYKQHGSHRVALIATDEDTIEKFIPVLFRAVLSGTHVSIKHPAKLGGRVLDTAFRGGVLSIASNAVRTETEEGPVTIVLERVVDFSRDTRAIEGEQRSVLVVDHMNNGEAMTTVMALSSSRKLSILGRFLRREYQTRMASLSDISLSDVETEVLATIYSTGDHDISLANVLDIEPTQVKQILHTLHEKGLIESQDDRPVLTPNGQIVVNQYLERVNA
ncbi:MAG: CheF family chemotaxis protein [Halobacteriales archaeon]|nr:CheF family chemotaxis protein [Halobacteriales archaeon]